MSLQEISLCPPTNLTPSKEEGLLLLQSPLSWCQYLFSVSMRVHETVNCSCELRSFCSSLHYHMIEGFPLRCHRYFYPRGFMCHCRFFFHRSTRDLVCTKQPNVENQKHYLWCHTQLRYVSLLDVVRKYQVGWLGDGEGSDSETLSLMSYTLRYVFLADVVRKCQVVLR